MTDQTILIIEDNPLNMELARDVLEAAGYTVVDARTAEEGLRIARAILPSLILLDIRLPGMNDSMPPAISSKTRAPDIPVVALTAQAMAGDEQTAFGAGFDGYITKPINTRTLSTRCGGGWSPPRRSERGGEAHDRAPRRAAAAAADVVGRVLVVDDEPKCRAAQRPARSARPPGI